MIDANERKNSSENENINSLTAVSRRSPETRIISIKSFNYSIPPPM